VTTLNYRHAFHAGNFADVFKHVLLARVLMHLRAKEAAFRVIDTHAGAGRYDLSASEAARTGEWRHGIGRLLASPPDGEALSLLKPYLDCVRTERGATEPGFYPGSPVIALALSRPQDRLIFCELHSDERQTLATAVNNRRVKVLESDGWAALKAQLPPTERRGLVFIDPPFEEPGEFQRFEQGLVDAVRRWATGIFMFWHPIKDAHETEAFSRRIARLGIPKILRVELAIRPVRADALNACAILTVNPPWTLEAELAQLMPYLTRILGDDNAGRHRIDWLAR
jgi:23S rRNA (adenine2030-N6)-methyltransferase